VFEQNPNHKLRFNEPKQLNIMSNVEPRWEHFAHGSDIGVRGIGPTKAVAFEQAGRALTAVITDPAAVTDRIQLEFECEAPDDDLLLMDWLNCLIYEMATLKVVFGHFQVEIHDHKLTAIGWGETVDVDRHSPAVEVKGATLTELCIRQTADGQWIAQCVVDV
jgi:tRNA nucleotidyltransferase (CCA-adding enzyme)